MLLLLGCIKLGDELLVVLPWQRRMKNKTITQTIVTARTLATTTIDIEIIDESLSVFGCWLFSGKTAGNTEIKRISK
jgi:hypothetical protein